MSDNDARKSDWLNKPTHGGFWWARQRIGNLLQVFPVEVTPDLKTFYGTGSEFDEEICEWPELTWQPIAGPIDNVPEVRSSGITRIDRMFWRTVIELGSGFPAAIEWMRTGCSPQQDSEAEALVRADRVKKLESIRDQLQAWEGL